MDVKYQEIDETKSYHREINMLRKKTNFTWGKNDDHWYSQVFHTRDTDTSDFWEQERHNQELPPPYSHVWTSENTGNRAPIILVFIVGQQNHKTLKLKFVRDEKCYRSKVTYSIYKKGLQLVTKNPRRPVIMVKKECIQETPL